jgi:hypothetical protein
MKIGTIYDRPDSTLVRVEPWPDMSFGASIDILHTRVQFRDDFPVGVMVRHGNHFTHPAIAREWANAILKACDIADAMIAPTQCALCAHVGPCLFDGEAYCCVDETNCQERQQAQRESTIDTCEEPPIGPQMPPDDWL